MENILCLDCFELEDEVGVPAAVGVGTFAVVGVCVAEEEIDTVSDGVPVLLAPVSTVEDEDERIIGVGFGIRSYPRLNI